MRTTVTVLVSCAILAGCSDPISQVAGSCAVIVKIDDALLTRAGIAGAEDLGPQFATVLADRECVDTFENVGGELTPEVLPLGHAESSGLPVGTPLHRFLGYPETERLIAVAGGELAEFRRVRPED